MDAAYDAREIKDFIRELGHVPLIDETPRGKERKAEIEAEKARQALLHYTTAETVHYRQRSAVERVNVRLKDDFGGRMARVRGALKVMLRLMLGVIALTVDQLMKPIKQLT